MMVRWIISMLGMYACALVFMYRAGVSVALVYMTQKSSSLTITNQQSLISSNINHSLDDPIKNFDWNQNKQGTILSASFYLYWCFPIVIGSLTDRFGGRWFAFSGVLGPCILSAIAPIAIEYYQDAALIIIQILIGGFHGFTYPALFSLYSKWFSTIERSLANSLMQVGNAIGCSLMYLLAGYLCSLTLIRWHLIFYVMSALHVPWLLLWFWFGANEPSSSKRISQAELKFINQNKCVKSKENVPTPWLRILCSTVVWSSIICKMCCAFGFFLLLNKMPSYFGIIFNLDIGQNGLMSAMVVAPFGLTSFLSPFLMNYLRKYFNIQPIQTKKISQNIAMVGPALCLILITRYQSNQTIVFSLMTVAMLMHGFFTSGEWTIVSDYAQNFSGSIVGFVHLLAFLMGALAPMVVSVIFESHSIGKTIVEKWNIIFYITAAIYLVGDVVFIIFGTDKQQEWDKV